MITCNEKKVLKKFVAEDYFFASIPDGEEDLDIDEQEIIEDFEFDEEPDLLCISAQHEQVFDEPLSVVLQNRILRKLKKLKA